MTESKEESEKRMQRELEGKNIAYYSVLLDAWIQTRMERDKTLVTISTAAIGLLVTILATVGVKSIWLIPFFTIAIVAFLITIWSSLYIYQRNSQHLEDAIKGSSKKDPMLEKYDKRSIMSFKIGLVFALIIGILSTSFQLIKSEENEMTDKENSSQNIEKTTSSNIGSVSGVTNINPNTITEKSLDGITNLNPQVVQEPSQSQDQTQSGSSSEGNTDNSSTGSDRE